MTRGELGLLIEGRAAASTGRGARLRERAGLTQSDVARLIDVTPAAVSRWEAGQRTPASASAVAYAQALRKIAGEMALHA